MRELKTELPPLYSPGLGNKNYNRRTEVGDNDEYDKRWDNTYEGLQHHVSTYLTL